MRTTSPRLIIAAATCAVTLGLSGLASAQTAADNTRDATQNAADKSGNAVERAGDKIESAADRAGTAIKNAGERITGNGPSTNPSAAMAPDYDDIQQTLKTVTQASVTKSGFDDLIERFVDADRNRLGKDGFTEKDHTILDGRIAQLQKDWKEKYNQDFKISDKAAVYDSSFATIIQNEIPGNNAQTASGRITPGGTVAGSGATGDGIVSPSGTSSRDNANVNNPPDNEKVAGGDTNLNPGRNTATVIIAASHGLPELRVPMIHEFPDVWKIDVPDNYSAEQLHDNLLKQLTAIDEMKSQWPSDPNDAYRAVTHRVLMAVLNVDEQGNGMQDRSMPGAMPNSTGDMQKSTTPGSMGR